MGASVGYWGLGYVMRSLHHLSIRSKIIGIILLTNVVGLGLAFGLVIFNDIRIFRDQLEDSSQAMAQLVAAYNVVPLIFDDPEDTESSLQRLTFHESFLEAIIFDAQGELFGRFPAEGKGLPDPTASSVSGYRDGYVEVVEPVVENLKRVGTVCLRFSTERLDQSINDYLLHMISVLAVMLLVSTLLSFLLGRVISRPILQLADVAHKIAEEGDYSLRVHKIGRDEIAELCDVFNGMLDQVYTRQLELERSNSELDHFARATSHDLKAPLRGIATLASWIEEDLRAEERLPASTAERLELLQRRVKRMEGLINGILEYSRVGRMDAQVQLIDCYELVQELVELLSPPSGLKITVADDLPVFRTKKVRLQQVFANLISNAVKHHDREEGEIQVSGRRDGDFYEFRVSDDGPGIPPQFQKKIFMIFQTLQPRDVVESTGVGLALVQKIVEGEGGHVEVESAGTRGTTFIFTWPARDPTEAVGGGKTSLPLESWIELPGPRRPDAMSSENAPRLHARDDID